MQALGKGLAWTTANGVLITLQPTETDSDRFEFGLNSPAAEAETATDT